MSGKTAEIIAVGTEILLGDIVNTNAQYIARGLSNLGINVYYQTVVGDNPGRLENALSLAKSRADIIITTGGLGPTYDDLTKETIAKNFGRNLKIHEESLEELTSFFTKLGRVMTENNLKQAMMPEDSIVVKNPQGTAPGCIIEGEDGKIAIMMPGPPREMKPMFDDSIIPYLRKFATDMLISKTMRIIGIGESTVEDMLRDMMLNMTNPTIAPYAKDGECVVRVTAKAKSEADAIALIDPIVEEIKGILGDGVYGVDIPSLEYHVVELLTQNRKVLACAESCTGGLLTKRLTDIPGSSKMFEFGTVTYSNEAKENILGVSHQLLEKYGAVSKECAIAMAKGVYNISGADIGVAITGIAGPDGGTEDKPVGLVFVAVYDGGRCVCKKLNYSRSRDYVRISATNTALDLVRKMVIHPND